MKTTIHVFLASSITDLEQDRVAVGDFINELNNIYNKQDIFIHLHKCNGESEDHSVKDGGSQEFLNNEIRESDMCFVLFWHKAGNVTKKELYEAVKAFDLKKNPKVEVYFKSLDEGETMTDDVRRIMKEVDDKLLHYHREYSHIDSLKLGIVTQLLANGFIRADMKVEKDSIILSGQKLASTENIPVYSRNKDYHKLVKKCRAAEEKCEKLFKEFDSDKNNKNAYNAYTKAVSVKFRLQGKLKEVSDKILNLGTNIANTILSSDFSENIREAIKCFDRGDYDGVQNLLRPDEIEERFSQTNLEEEMLQIKRQHCIDEYRWRISSLEAQGKWKEVQNNYERATIMVEGALTSPKAIMLEYAKFLHGQGRYEKSIEICTRLQSALAQYANALSKEKIAEMYDLQGELYYQTRKYEEAETYLKQAIELRRDIGMQSQDKDMQNAGSYVKLAKVYYMVTRYFEAEDLYLQALNIYEKYDTKSTEKVDVCIAHTNLELGELYYMINRHEDAGKVRLSAYQKYKELVDNGMKNYEAAMAEAAYLYAFLSITVCGHVKAEPYYVQAMKVKQVLTQRDPVEYFTFLERILRKLGGYWTENGNASYGSTIQNEAERIRLVIQNKIYANKKEEFRALNYDYYIQPLNKTYIESLLLESIRMFNVLADENPEAYEPYLAKAYNVTGFFYTQIGEKHKAEINYNEAIEIGKRLVEREQSMKPILAISCSNLALHYSSYNKVDKAITRTLQAIDLYTSVKTREDSAYDTDIARNYNTLANLYAKAGDLEQAEQYYKEALTLYIKLYEKSPRAYVDRIINTTNNIIMLFDPIESSDWMNEFVKEDKVLEWLQNKD